MGRCLGAGQTRLEAPRIPGGEASRPLDEGLAALMRIASLSLDEVTQLLNVLRGEMSLVGPRPLPLRDYEKIEDWHRKRYLVLRA
jgi:hypothetical protein